MKFRARERLLGQKCVDQIFPFHIQFKTRKELACIHWNPNIVSSRHVCPSFSTRIEYLTDMLPPSCICKCHSSPERSVTTLSHMAISALWMGTRRMAY